MSRKIVSCIAYLIGVKDIKLSQFDPIIVNDLKMSNGCNLIRTLCQFRTQLLRYYYEIERKLKENYGKISDIGRFIALYDTLINNHGIDLNMYSTDVKEYIIQVNNLIDNNINSVKNQFPSTITNKVWQYIRELFIYPNEKFLEERKLFIENIEFYPFGSYINWTPIKAGNILETDTKLLSILFSNKGKEYSLSKEEALSEIESFINSRKHITICVDCENVDYSLFYSALLQFNENIINRIERILLFDSNDRKSGWNYYGESLPIKIERIECPRILNDKSTLDVKMSAYITAIHYRDGIDGFILVSSDSDYWGLIDTIGTTAKFFILGEKNNMSEKNINKLTNRGIPCFLLDEFDNNELRQIIKEEILIKEIKEQLYQIRFNVNFFLNMMQTQTKNLSKNDKSIFKKIVCNIKISFDEDGNAIYTI